MVMRVGGLASGMDIDALVEKLMKAEKAPLNKLYQKKTTSEWQRDAYRGVNAKLKTFDTYIADNLVLKKINTKTASSSNSNLVSATATGDASGSLSIESVSQLASSARGIGKPINATGSTNVSSLFANAADMPSTIKLQSVDKQGNLIDPVEIKINQEMTIDELVKSINNSSAGVSAIFESGRFSITAKNTGQAVGGGDALQADAAGKELFSKLGLGDGTNSIVTEKGKNAIFQVNGIVTERASNTFSINGYNVTLNAKFNENKLYDETQVKLTEARANLENTMSPLVSAYGVTFDNGETTTEQRYATLASHLSGISTTRQANLASANTALTNARNVLALTDTLSTSYSQLSAETKAFISGLTDEQRDELASADLTNLAATSFTHITDEQKQYLQQLSDEGSADLTALDNYSSSELATLKEPKTVGQIFDTLSADAKAKLSTLAYNDIDSATDISNEDKAILSSLSAEGYMKLQNFESNVSTLQSDVQNAETSLQAVNTDLASLNNKGNLYNQASAMANNVGSAPTNSTSATTVTLTSTTNVDDMMTKIKDFVNTYNGLIKELNDQTKQTKYRDYAPLTDEQKKDMSENEIKLWDEKAKSGLLRNDSLIRNGLSNMRSLIYQSNPAISDSKYNTLFSIGITTSKSYNDGGTLEIDEDKLRKAIEENPDAVEKLFKNTEGKKDDIIDGQTVDTRGYLEKLRDSMKTFEVNIEKKAGRSTMTDHQYTIGKSLLDTEKRISTWQTKLKDIESRYWKQFTAMEKAINKANQQSSMFFQQQSQ